MFKIVNNILTYGLVVVATFLLFFTDANPWIVTPIYLFFLSMLLIRWQDKKHKLKIPDYIYFFGLLAMYLNVFGEFFFRLYYNLVFYDKILHFVVPVYLVFLAGFFIKKNVRYRFVWIFLAVITLCLFWEGFEYFADSISGTTIMRGVVIDFKEMTGGFDDTVMDMVFAFIGTLTGLMVSWRLKK